MRNRFVRVCGNRGVVGTEGRGSSAAEEANGRIRIERVDINDSDQVHRLRRRLSGELREAIPASKSDVGSSRSSFTICPIQAFSRVTRVNLMP